jgi:hypothetical protein
MKYRALFLLAVLGLASIFAQVSCASIQNPEGWPASIADRQSGVDFAEVARRFPRLKTIVLVSFTHDLTIDDTLRLQKLGALPQGGGSRELVGRRWAVLHTRAGNLARLQRLPMTLRVVPLRNFKIKGIYRVTFKLVEEHHQGDLTFTVSTPRSGFGKKLMDLEIQATPQGPHAISQDAAGNRWLKVHLPDPRNGDEVRLSFNFVYKVDMAELLAHSLAMVPMDESVELSNHSPAMVYLQPSDKIAAGSKSVVALANIIYESNRSPRRIYQAIGAFIKANLPYDREKRKQFFGGQKIYFDMEHMYKSPEATLSSGKAACPSTSVLEAAILRASGVPARTAGRWGHFYSELYIPGRGWLSTSVTPTGIPLVVDPDHRHKPFANWAPTAAVQTTEWSGWVKVLLDSDHE